MRESLLTLPMSNLRWTIKGCLKAADFFYFRVKLSIKDQSIFIYILLCIFLNKIFLKLTRNFIFNIISILHVTSTISTPPHLFDGIQGQEVSVYSLLVRGQEQPDDEVILTSHGRHSGRKSRMSNNQHLRGQVTN